jgi:alkylation response protein AidB-like acyl-CoA dehydrogenase
MDFSLTKQQHELVLVVRELAEQEIKPYARSKNFSQNNDFDWYLVRKLGEHNLICPTVPKEYGGLGLDIFTTALVIEEIAAACPGLAAVIDTNLHAVQPLLLAATPKQKEKFLPGLTGISASLAAFALTEPSGGSDLNSMTTLAHKTSHGFLINGRKRLYSECSRCLINLFVCHDRPAPKETIAALFHHPAGHKRPEN